MIRLFKVQMASEAKELVGQVLDSGYIGQGQKVEEFETELKRVFELDQDVITVNSATSGLDLALHMIGVREGDEVITTPVTCFGYLTKVQTDQGFIEIGKIVNKDLRVSVLSYNQETKQLEYKPVIKHIKLPANNVTWYRLGFVSSIKSNKGNIETVLVTGDHKILTVEGYKRVDELDTTDKIVTRYAAANTLQQELIDGSLLGDGFIQFGGKRNLKGRFGITHAETQKEYLDLKVSALKGFSNNYRYAAPYKQSKGRYDFQTHTSPYWRNQALRWYPNGIKIVPSDLQLTPLMIAVWYMDDGARWSDKGAVFCTDAFDNDSRERLVYQLNKLEINAYSGSRGRIYIRNASRLWDIIAPYVPDSMRYKIESSYVFDSNLWELGIAERFADTPIISKTIPSVYEKASHVYCLEVQDNHNFIAGKIVVSNCTATNSPIVNRHAIPVWADVDNCGLINPIDVARKITNKTKAIMAVNWGGSMPNYTALKSFGIPVIEDAAHGTYWSAKERGNYVVWSFQAIKHLTCGDGGALVSPDPERARLLRWYGLNRRTSASFRCEQNIQEVGYKYHMNDINAAIGLCNLKYLRDNVSASRFNAHYYYNNIKNSRVTLLDYDDNSSYWIYTILVDNPKKFIAYMAEREIEASPVHARNDKHAGFYYPNGELKGVDYFDAHQVSIPNGAWISHKELQYIVDTINSYKGE